jgi:hypothetical protein
MRSTRGAFRTGAPWPTCPALRGPGSGACCASRCLAAQLLNRLLDAPFAFQTNLPSLKVTS